MSIQTLNDQLRYFEVQLSFIKQQPISEADKAHRFKVLSKEMKQTFNIPNGYDRTFNKNNKEVVKLYRQLNRASNFIF